MEVASPLSPDFDFNSSIYATAPSTPKLIGHDYYFSAPPSPTQITEFHLDFDEPVISDHDTPRSNSLATVPFAWEEKPGVPKSFGPKLSDNEFAFDVVSNEIEYEHEYEYEVCQERGRERSNSTHGLKSSRSRRTRSLPPFRGFDQPPPVPENMSTTTRPTLSTCTTLATSDSGKGSKKWSFMDLFLFRSASDGRAMDKDPFKKYSATFRKHDEDFRNLRSDRSGSGSGSKRRGRVSAHELHYNVNRAVSNDLKKKSFLPYKQGILGRLAFNPSVHALANGFGFSHNN